jgi:glycosyltransferase involved in cell wall biosynthesis
MLRLINSTELNRSFNVRFLDISDPRSPDNIGKFDITNVILGVRQALRCLGLLLFRPPEIVYLGISQGLWGYLRDLTFILPAICFRKKLILHLRGSEFRSFYGEMPAWLKWITRIVLRRTSRVIVLGTNLKSIFAGLVQPDQVVVIPNGIAYQEFGGHREMNPAARNGKRILYLSSLMKRKGLFLLLEALPAVFAQHGDAEATLAGLWQSNAEREEAEALITKLKLRGRIAFPGEVTGAAKIELLNEHDLFVFTPVAPEGLPWVILEAMSASLPVITTDQGAIAEVVQDSHTGLIVAPTPEHLANGICRLLEDPPTARAMGHRGRKRVEANFSEEGYLAKLIALFHEVTAEGKGAPGRGVIRELRRDCTRQSVK